MTAFVYFQHLGGCRHLAGQRQRVLEGAAAAGAGRRAAVLLAGLLPPASPGAADPLRPGRRAAWVFDGTAPWMTGWGLADEVLLAGTLPDGRSAWVVAPLVESETLRASPPMRLFAMNASATVSLSCRRLRIEAERHVKAMTPEELEGDTAGAILFFTACRSGWPARPSSCCGPGTPMDRWRERRSRWTGNWRLPGRRSIAGTIRLRR